MEKLKTKTFTRYLLAFVSLLLLGTNALKAEEKTALRLVPSVVTFDFNVLGPEYGYGTSNTGNAGDLTNGETFIVDGIKLAVSTNPGGNVNRFWRNTSTNLIELRLYKSATTMTIDAGERTITKVVVNNTSWGSGNTFNGETATKGEWTGEANTVVMTVANTTYMTSVVVYLASDDPLAEAKADLQATIAEVEKIALDDYTAESAGR